MKRITITLICLLVSCLTYAQDRTEVILVDFVSSEQDASTAEACTMIFKTGFASNIQWSMVDSFKLSSEMIRRNYDKSTVTDAQLVEICSSLGLEVIIAGNLRVEDLLYVLEVRIIDVATGKVKDQKSVSWKKGIPFRSPVTGLSQEIRPAVMMPVDGGMESVISHSEVAVNRPVADADPEPEPVVEVKQKHEKVEPSGLLLNGYDSCSKVDLDPAGGEWTIKVTLETGSISKDCVLSPPTSWYKAVLSDDGALKLTFSPNHGDLRKGRITVSAGNETADFTFIQAGLPNAIEENVWMSKLSRLLGVPTVTYTNGAYRGGLVDFPTPEIRNGTGLYRWSDDTIYIGYWRENKKNGRGIHATPKGLVFAQLPGCRIMVADFLNDVPRGNMRCYDRNGRLLYDGPVYDWSPESVYPAKELKSSYSFDFVQYDDGSCYIGEMSGGKKEGYGLFIDSSGRPWAGTWRSDSKVGGEFF